MVLMEAFDAAVAAGRRFPSRWVAPVSLSSGRPEAFGVDPGAVGAVRERARKLRELAATVTDVAARRRLNDCADEFDALIRFLQQPPPSMRLKPALG